MTSRTVSQRSALGKRYCPFGALPLRPPPMWLHVVTNPQRQSNKRSQTAFDLFATTQTQAQGTELEIAWQEMTPEQQQPYVQLEQAIAKQGDYLLSDLVDLSSRPSKQSQQRSQPVKPHSLFMREQKLLIQSELQNIHGDTKNIPVGARFKLASKMFQELSQEAQKKYHEQGYVEFEKEKQQDVPDHTSEHSPEHKQTSQPRVRQMSGYTYFLKHNGGSGTFASLSARWRELSDAEKQVWSEAAKGMQVTVKKESSPQGVHFFIASHRDVLSSQHPHLPKMQIRRLILQRWNNLSNAEKKQWTQKAKEKHGVKRRVNAWSVFVGTRAVRDAVCARYLSHVTHTPLSPDHVMLLLAALWRAMPRSHKELFRSDPALIDADTLNSIVAHSSVAFTQHRPSHHASHTTSHHHHRHHHQSPEISQLPSSWPTLSSDSELDIIPPTTHTRAHPNKTNRSITTRNPSQSPPLSPSSPPPPHSQITVKHTDRSTQSTINSPTPSFANLFELETYSNSDNDNDDDNDDNDNGGDGSGSHQRRTISQQMMCKVSRTIANFTNPLLIADRHWPANTHTHHTNGHTDSDNHRNHVHSTHTSSAGVVANTTDSELDNGGDGDDGDDGDGDGDDDDVSRNSDSNSNTGSECEPHTGFADDSLSYQF